MPSKSKYEIAKRHLFRWASYYMTRYPGRFEFWELVNAVWCDRSFQNTNRYDPYLSNRIRWSMMDYIRDKDGLRKQSSPHMHTHSNRDLTLLRATVNNGSDHVETLDLVCFLLNHSGLSNRESHVIRYYCLRRQPICEVRKTLRSTNTTVFNIINSAYQKMKECADAYGIADIFTKD